MSETIKMIGLALDGSGVTKEVDVHPDNILAFKNSGYMFGSLPVYETSPVIVETSEIVEQAVNPVSIPRGRPKVK